MKNNKNIRNRNTEIIISIQYPNNNKKYKKVSREFLVSSTYEKFLNELELLQYKKYKILINGKITNTYNHNKLKELYTNANENTNVNEKSNSKYIQLEIIPNINGGFIAEFFSAIINIFKLLAGIPRLFMYVGRLIVWLLQFLYFIIAVLINVLDTDGILGLCKYIASEIIMAPFKFIFYMIKKAFNSFGYMTIAAVSGADNVTRQDEDEPTEFHSTTGYEEKCYRTSDGMIPFSVIIATVLCPPVGVFMEYGLYGWFNILICGLLTLAFYFPGLIYALILLYC
jgi:uncharacterized membrane protein YqaE (UPF0057 family)